jgi:spore germination protein (amino acid permease)
MYPTDIIASTKEAHWIPIILGVIIHFIFISIYMKGLSYYPKKNIIAIYLSHGKIIAWIFLLPIAVYLLMTIIITIRAYSEIITIVFLSNTPLWAIMLLFVLVATYLTSIGIDGILRSGLLLAILFLPLILFGCLISFQNVDWREIFPLTSNDFHFIAKPTYLMSYFSIGGVFMFIGFVQPFFSYKRKKILYTALLLVPFWILSVYIPILTFGDSTASHLYFPFVEAVDSIDIDWLMFDRVTMIFLLSLITFIILFLSLVLWMFLQIITPCIPKLRANYLLILISFISFVCCMFIPDWQDVEKLLLFNSPFRFFCLLIVPPSIWILGIRSKRKGELKNE